MASKNQSAVSNMLGLPTDRSQADHHNRTYRHTQRSPLCVLIYVLASVMFVTTWFVRDEAALQMIFIVSGLMMVCLAASFHHLTVEDEGDRLSIRFGPLPLFRRSVVYDRLVSVHVGRTNLIDGWGIHKSLKGGWVWNLWGFDCVVLELDNGTLRIGTDAPQPLANFLHTRMPQH